MPKEAREGGADLGDQVGARVPAGYRAEVVLVGLGHRRVVVDPDVENEKAVARFLRQGFVAGPVVVLPEIDLPDVYLPEKRAQLAFLSRGVAFPG